EPMYRWGSMAVADRDTFAYLTMRNASGTPDGKSVPRKRVYELGVCGYGPRGADLAGRVAEQIHRWDRNGRSLSDIWIEVHPAGTTPRPPGHLIARKHHTQVVVRAASATS
ncbi:hypothetical protein ACFQ07_04940, partial [Actinomadura adrarensis]